MPKEDMMRFYNQPHRFYCGVDLHARTMYLCILDSAGAIVLHQNLTAHPDAFRHAIAPYRDGLVVACECMFAWYWLADLSRAEGRPPGARRLTGAHQGRAHFSDHHLGRKSPYRSGCVIVPDPLRLEWTGVPVPSFYLEERRRPRATLEAALGLSHRLTETAALARSRRFERPTPGHEGFSRA
jgi:hypothetical protein